MYCMYCKKTELYVRVVSGEGMLKHNLVHRTIEEPRPRPSEIGHLVYERALTNYLNSGQCPRTQQNEMSKTAYSTNEID